ncbi:hypothetical protein HZB58_02755 [Candidatus Gottesmanbacteria bacterium]|nr:hypothetical protein [Candidatus Gottesmanbacteria bacterium]
MISKQLLKDGFGWGFVLWFIGYILGIILFMLVPPWLLGWIITPIGTLLTIWVLNKKFVDKGFSYYVALAVIWTILAILLDYFLLVRVFNPADGYYKFDVYLYYTLTFLLPIAVGWRKNIKLETL